MILVDTSVWVDHFRDGNPRLTELLNNQEVLIHPFVVGELSLGLLKNRVQILDLLSKLPPAPTADHEEVIAAVGKHRLFGVGMGWVDAHTLLLVFSYRLGWAAYYGQVAPESGPDQRRHCVVGNRGEITCRCSCRLDLGWIDRPTLRRPTPRWVVRRRN